LRAVNWIADEWIAAASTANARISPDWMARKQWAGRQTRRV